MASPTLVILGKNIEPALAEDTEGEIWALRNVEYRERQEVTHLKNGLLIMLSLTYNFNGSSLYL